MAPPLLTPSASPPPLPPRLLRMRTEGLELTPSLCRSLPPAPLPLLPSPLLTVLPSPLLIVMALPNPLQVLPSPLLIAMALPNPRQVLPNPPLIAMALPNPLQVLPNPPQTVTAPPQFSPHPSRRLTTAMVLPPHQLLMNTSPPVRMSPPPSPTPPPMTPASVQIPSGLRTVLGPASLTVTARPASRTRSSVTTAAWTAMGEPHPMTPRRCPACQDGGIVVNVGTSGDGLGFINCNDCRIRDLHSKYRPIK